MRTTSSKSDPSAVTAWMNSTPAKSTGVWTRLFRAIAHARELQAKREVARYLAARPDRYLRDIGMSEVEIADLRRQQTY